MSAASVSIIVPCFNEAEGVGQLRAQLVPALRRLALGRRVEVVLVDDGSTDGTGRLLAEAFADVPEARVVAHERNRNLGASVRTGVASSSGDWILFLDADCTYPPEIVERFVAALEGGADLVTASPYHPHGKVEGVPAWRLGLSRGASWLYRRLLGRDIHTYTALARGWRRDVASELASPADDFTAVADMMLRALVQGRRVVEVPAVLGVRQFGQSKMRVLKVIAAHLRLMTRLLFRRSSFRA